MDYASHSHRSAKLFHVDFHSCQCDGHDVQEPLADWKGGMHVGCLLIKMWLMFCLPLLESVQRRKEKCNCKKMWINVFNNERRNGFYSFLFIPHRQQSRWCACPDPGADICGGPSAWERQGNCTPPRHHLGHHPPPATWSYTAGWSKTYLHKMTHRWVTVKFGLQRRFIKHNPSSPHSRDSLGLFLQPPAVLPLLQVP